MTNVTVVVGAQFGSEGKGAITAYLAQNFNEHDVVIRVAGPNAGHTAYDGEGREWKLRAVPVAAVTSRKCQLHIAAGSEIDYGVLFDEIERLDEAGHDVRRRLTVHPSATLILQDNLDEEAAVGLTHRVGSTGKGIGSARAGRIMRSQPTADQIVPEDLLSEPGPFDLDGISNLLIEGTQGYGLGLHTRFYPQVTSSDCRAIDFLAMAGVNPWAHGVHMEVILVARTYPIRVAGNSGVLLNETSWAQLGLPEERTTVTNNVRRVGMWDEELVLEAIKANGGGDFSESVKLAITMVDHLFPGNANLTELKDDASKFIEELEARLECFIEFVGTGPKTVVEL